MFEQKFLWSFNDFFCFHVRNNKYMGYMGWGPLIACGMHKKQEKSKLVSHGVLCSIPSQAMMWRAMLMVTVILYQLPFQFYIIQPPQPPLSLSLLTFLLIFIILSIENSTKNKFKSKMLSSYPLSLVSHYRRIQTILYCL